MILKFLKIKKINFDKGALLLELLIVIALIAVVFTVGTQAVMVSLRSGKNSTEKDIAYSLANEAVEIARSIAESDWLLVYSPNGIVKGTTHYYPLKVNNSWTLVEGDETLTVNSISFTRSIVIDNVSRDSTSDRKIEYSYNSSNDDPNTQKITVNVSWYNADQVSVSSYVFRWKNNNCVQTEWTTYTDPDDNLETCPTSVYRSKDAGIDVSTPESISLSGTTPKAVSGTIISSGLDSEVASGVGYNSIMWLGSLGGAGQNEGKVRFQIAASSEHTGPYNFYGGATCGSSDWFDPGAPNTPIEIKGSDCISQFNNKRYFKYKVQLCSDDCSSAGNNSPIVNDIIINYAP